ncbi:hypothetical protein DY000_02029573 [Brassica cretica]|uniref:Endonuclease/exonuclease/phosphatase domain-containing protein n=1 Tax=Brassica cretica TaxID=69181 RepID=A0ABQ7DL76_BRACR|nr:hypothetical protein DY000_02029573 [Brassica cretica]
MQKDNQCEDQHQDEFQQPGPTKIIWKEMQKLKLGADRSCWTVHDDVQKEFEKDHRLCLVALGLNSYHQNPPGIKVALPKIWQLEGKVEGQIKDDGTVNFYFQHYAQGDESMLDRPDQYRNLQWRHLIDSENAGFLQNKPRIPIGDFNDIKRREEKQGGLTRSVGSFSLFNRMLSVLGLHDLKTLGGRFTWLGRRSKYTIMSRIDRAVANCGWLDMYPMATVSLLPWIGSDHRALLLDTDKNKKKKRLCLYMMADGDYSRV